jgi:tRNA (guanosine-2'-O-)-methyltransferase
MKDELSFLEYLKSYITDHKIDLIEQILNQRTRFFTVVLEDIFKPHNASAVLRTCDCFGIQDIHIIEKATSYKVNPYVTRGASQWIDVHTYQDSQHISATKSCFDQLRQSGYKIYATSPNIKSIPIQKLPMEKMALVLGNEHLGVSQEVLDLADGTVHIPMYGFTESFNISVAASIILYELRRQLNEMKPSSWNLSDIEKNKLRSKWYREIVKNSEIHEKYFHQNLNT